MLVIEIRMENNITKLNFKILENINTKGLVKTDRK